MELPAINKRLVAEIGLGMVAILALSSMVYNWYHPQTKTVSRVEYQPVPVEKKVETIKRVTVPGPERIVTIEKPVIVEKLKLPDEIKTDPAKQITGNAEVPRPKVPGATTSVVSVLDTNTGETQIIAKENPPSLFGFPDEKEMGVRYGLRTDGLQGAAMYGRWQFFRAGNVYLGAYGEIDSRPEGKLMLDVSYKF